MDRRDSRGIEEVVKRHLREIIKGWVLLFLVRTLIMKISVHTKLKRVKNDKRQGYQSRVNDQRKTREVHNF